jgi:EH_Signature domain
MSLFAKLNQPVLYQPPSLPAPTSLAAAARRILSRWPDVVADPPEHDRERLVTEMLRRLSTGDWKGARMSFVTSAARALFDAERRSRPALEPLRRFYCGEIEASDSRTFLAAMMSVYLGSYDPGATHTVALARSLAKVRQRLDTRSRLLVDEVPAVLDPHKGAVALGSLMSQMDDPWQGLRDLHLLSPHAPGIMDFAHIAFVDRLAPRLDQPAEIDRLLRWLKPDGHEPRASGAGEAIEALLMPWRDRDPSPHMQHDLITRVVGYYGDPRVRGHAGAWSSVSDELLTILLRWLTGANIRFFLEVVSAVEDSHMWAPREKFWLTLYNQKRIDAAWVAFSDAGAALARRKAGNRTIPFGRQTAGGNRSGTCLLILKIGEKIVVEGSSNYKIHIFDERNPRAPKLYQHSYDCDAIRRISGAQAKMHLGHWEGWVLERI